MSELNLDVSADVARALHRVVRAIHDGHCPACGHLGPSDAFYFTPYSCPISKSIGEPFHQCPRCDFRVLDSEAEAAMKAFEPFMKAATQVFNGWRGEPLPKVPPLGPPPTPVALPALFYVVGLWKRYGPKANDVSFIVDAGFYDRQEAIDCCKESHQRTGGKLAWEVRVRDEGAGERFLDWTTVEYLEKVK